MEDTCGKIRQLVDQLHKMEPPSKKVAASPLMRVIISRVNALTASSPVRSEEFAGIWRKGTAAGERWGSWLPNSDPTLKVVLKDGSESLVEFLPRIGERTPILRLGVEGWAVFSHQQRDMEIHRQLWQDHWNCTLPSWIHIHHKGTDRPNVSKKLDNRLEALELRDQKDHGKEHGFEGGVKSRKGRARGASPSASGHTKRRRTH